MRFNALTTVLQNDCGCNPCPQPVDTSTSDATLNTLAVWGAMGVALWLLLLES